MTVKAEGDEEWVSFGEKRPPIACPDCGTKGRKVEPRTPESLLTEDAKAGAAGAADLRFCKTAGCEVVYYGDDGESRFVTADVRVPVFQKSTDPSRLVCYCFEHRVADIEKEVARTGASAAADRITDKCRQGLDRCEEMNPQGACCLGNVRQVIKAAIARPAAHSASAASAVPGEPQDCFAVEQAAEAFAEQDVSAVSANAVRRATPTTPRERNAGLWSAGAVTAAALSAACCWLPLLLIAMGASAAGVGVFFESYRAYFLGGTALLLGAGFYTVYGRKPQCAPGEACEMPNPRLLRLSKTMLWVATAFVVAFAAFPNYVGVLLGGTDGPPAAATATLSSRAYVIEGMTCEEGTVG